MNQEKYNLIVKSIQFAMPALADELITALNSCIRLSNERLDEIRAMQETKTETKKESE